MLSKEEIPNHWEIKLVEDVIINAKNGGTPKRSEDDYWGGDIQWLSSGEVSKGKIYSADEKITEKGLEESSAKLFPKNSILVAMYGKTRGKSAILREQMSGNQALCCLETDDSEIKLEYLHYYLKRIRDRMASEGRGGGQDNINQSVILNQKVPVPPLDEQKAIIEKLDLIFENIKKIQDAQEQAEDIRGILGNSAYKSIFDDLIANYPIAEVENIADEIKNGGTPKRSEDSYWGGTIPWIKSGELNEGYISSSEEYLTNKGLNEGSAKLMDSGTVLIAMYGATRGKTAILQNEMTTNQAICGVLVNEDEIYPEFLQFCMKARKRELVDKGRGGGQDNINQTTIKQTKIPLPPLNIQEEVLERIGDIENALKEEYSVQREQIVDTLPNTVLAVAFKGDLVDFGATSESDELGSTEQKISEKQESSFDGEGQQSLGEYR